jgi:hypothetical protein
LSKFVIIHVAIDFNENSKLKMNELFFKMDL